MRFPWFGRARQRTSIADSSRFSWSLGRRHVKTAAYALPKDLLEDERLNLQHYIIRSILHGNHAVPFDAMKYQPKSILDVACGTGRWCAEVAQEFPEASIVGIDLVQPDLNSPAITLGNSQAPDNLVMEQGDVTKGLPFADNTFDYTHMRLVVVGLSARDWPFVVSELLRVTRPGGWIELNETNMDPAHATPAFATYNTWVEVLTSPRGFDVRAGEHIEQRLRHVGLINVSSHMFTIPVGKWGGRVGTMTQQDLMAGARGIASVFAKMHIATEQEVETTLTQMERDLETKPGAKMPLYVAYGQKPILTPTGTLTQR